MEQQTLLRFIFPEINRRSLQLNQPYFAASGLFKGPSVLGVSSVKNNRCGAHVSERTPLLLLRAPGDPRVLPSADWREAGGPGASQGRARGGGCSRHEPRFYERLLFSGGGFSHSPKLALNLKYEIFFFQPV